MNYEGPSNTDRQTSDVKKMQFIKNLPENVNRFLKEHSIKLLIVLTAIVFFTLVASIWHIITNEDASKFLPPPVLSSAALIAILAYWREHNKADLENKRSKSEFFLTRASDGLTAVYELLKDRNNDRIIWIRAARTLLEAKKLSEEIELEAYQRAYHLYEQQIRNDLYLVLRTYDHNVNSFQPLPPQFFFGTPRWASGESLDELARETSQKFEVHNVSIDKIPLEPPLGPLSEESVCAIFDFLDYPKDFKDPLKEVQLWSGDWHVFGPRVGAARYIHHRQTKYAVGGKLFDRNSEGGSSEGEES
jgi:hypothetical protein